MNILNQTIATPLVQAVFDPSAKQDGQQGSESIELKSEILRWIFSILSSVIVFILFALIVSALYHPDTDQLLNIARKLLINSDKALPEPMEALLFRSGIVIILGSLIVFYTRFSRSAFIINLASKRSFNVITIVAVAIIAAIIIIDFASPNLSDFGSRRFPPTDPDYNNNNFNFYFNEFFIGKYLWLYALIIVPAIVVLFLIGFLKWQWESKRSFTIIVYSSGYLVTSSVVLAIVLMNIFSLPYSVDNTMDLNAVYYSMTQVFAGIPMLVDGFTNTYGLYPHFLNLIFQITGLDIFKFTLVLSLLLGLSFLLNFLSLRKFVRNPVILFLGFATMLFFSCLDRKLLNFFDCYFALFPIRYLGPSVLVFFASAYVFRPSRWLYWVMLAGMASFVLWNPEMGLVSYVSMVLFFIYRDFFRTDGKLDVKKIGEHVLSGIIILISVFYLYKLLIYLFYGSVPDLSLLFSTMAVFSKVGFGLLPMALIHPWNLVALLLISGFAYALMQWYKKEITPKASIVFLLSLMGVGYLFYYQGRSHSVNLSVSTGFCLLMFTILGDELWYIVKNSKILALRALIVLFLFLTSFSFIELITGAGKIYTAVTEQDKKETDVKLFSRFLESNRNLVVNNTIDKEKILVLTVAKDQSLYFDGTRLRSAFNPGLVELFLNTDLDRFNKVVRDSSFTVFIEPVLFDYPFMQQALASIAAQYEFKGFGKTMAMVKKRTETLPAARFLFDTSQLILYRKYRGDSTGISFRINDALGNMQVAISQTFSVQTLFQNRIQIFKDAAVIGNRQDSSGFIIKNVFNSPDYWFGVNNEGLKVHVPQNKWIYAVFNVFPDHMDVYINGSLAATHPLLRPMTPSDAPLSIGNIGYQQFYVGAISEVAIRGNVIRPEEIQEIWGKVERGVVK